MTEDYKVGKGRPPLHSRFRPGRSGNPKGRPKGANGIAELLDKILSRKVAVREGGSTSKVTVKEAVLMSMAAKAIKGDHRAAAFLMKALETYHDSSGGRMTSERDPEEISESIRQKLEAMAERIQQRESDP